MVLLYTCYSRRLYNIVIIIRLCCSDVLYACNIITLCRSRVHIQVYNVTREPDDDERRRKNARNCDVARRVAAGAARWCVAVARGLHKSTVLMVSGPTRANIPRRRLRTTTSCGGYGTERGGCHVHNICVCTYIYIYVSRTRACIYVQRRRTLKTCATATTSVFTAVSPMTAAPCQLVRMCVCVCPSSPVHAHTHTHTHTYMYIMFEQRETNKKKKTPNWEKK